MCSLNTEYASLVSGGGRAFVHLNICPGSVCLWWCWLLAPCLAHWRSEEKVIPARAQSWDSGRPRAPPGQGFMVTSLGSEHGEWSWVSPWGSDILLEFYRNCFDCLLLWEVAICVLMTRKHAEVNCIDCGSRFVCSIPQPTLRGSDLYRVFRDHKQTLISRHKTEWEPHDDELSALHFSSLSLSTMTSQMTNRQFVQGRPAPCVQSVHVVPGDATLYKLSLKVILPAPGSGGGPGPTHSHHLHSVIVLHLTSEE